MRFSNLLVVTLGVVLISAIASAYPPDALPEAHALMREKKYVQASAIIDDYLKSNRFDGAAWSTYGVCLHMQKEYAPSIDASKHAIELGYNVPNEQYNIVCAYALMGRADDAIAWLATAMQSGFTEQETLEKDDETNSLRTDPRFIEITGLNPPSESSPSKRWAYDLDFLIRRMEQMHWSLYAKVSKGAFRDEIEKLKADAPNLTLERVKARLSKIIAMVGDGHTTLAAFAEGEEHVNRIPLQLRQFGGSLYVIGAVEAHRDLVGTKVLRIGSLDVSEALKRIRAFCSVDNEMGFLAGAPIKLNNPAALQEIGAISGDDVEYTLQFADGTTRTATVSPEPINAKELRSSRVLQQNFVYANAASTAPTPLYLQHDSEPLWFTSVDDRHAIYFGFHAVADNEKQSFEDFIDGLTKEIDQKHAEYLIIDMRNNGGGNTGLVLPLIHALIKNDRINQPGHLYVITGRNTFSAAQNTVNLLELHTHATFVGEPTGSRPNFVGESTHIILPYSKLRVYCSSRYWQHVVSTDHRTWVQPQIAAELSFDDFVQNRDPCMDAILKRIAAVKKN